MKKRALLLGVPSAGDSGAPFLSSVDRDITLLAEVLRAPDGAEFLATEIVGPGALSTACDQLRRRVELFFRASTPSTLNLLYVAAHASVASNGLLQVLPSDYSKANPQASSIPLSFIGACLPVGEQDCSIIFLDCCFADRGSWELFSRQASVLSFGPERNPSYCIISSTRASDPAVDGLFAPILAEALERLDPDPRLGGSVTLDRIYDYVESQLRPQYQMPRLWQSRSTSVPLGRSTIGLRADCAGLPDLYAFSPSRSLSSSVGPQTLYSDYIERETTDQGFGIRTGLRVLEGKPAVLEVEQAVAKLEEAVSHNELENGLVILTDDNAVRSLRTERVIVRSYAEFRRVLVPTLRYLENWIADYEAWDPVHVDRCYVSLTGLLDEESESVQFDEHVLSWICAPEAVPMLTVLGEFGTGKTTTLRRIFWEQARLHLASPARCRLPIFLTLREIDGALDMEALVERSVAKMGAGRRMTYEHLDALNKAGRVVWLLDGFDEMAVRVTESVISRNLEQILRLAERRSRLVLTCRTSFFRNRDEVDRVMRYTELHHQLRTLAGDKYKILAVNQLTDVAIEAFVRAKTESSAEILSLLSDNQEFRNLAGRPILLQMIVETLPALVKRSVRLNAASLYREYTEKLLLRDAWRNTLEEEDRRRFCQFLAWRFYSTGEYEISYSAFPDLIRRLFPEDVRLAEDWKALEVAVRSTSFLSRDDRGQFSFAHKSFMEFFAASHLLERILSEAHGESELGGGILSVEVIRFLAQLVGELSDACRTVTALAASSKFGLGYFFSRYLRERLVPVSKRGTMTLAQRSILSKSFVALLLGGIFLVFLYVAMKYQDAQRFGAKQWLAVLFAVPVAVLGTTIILFLGYCWSVWRGTEGNPYSRLNATAVAIGAQIMAENTPVAGLLSSLPERDRKQAERLVRAVSGQKSREPAERPVEADSQNLKASLWRWLAGQKGKLSGEWPEDRKVEVLKASLGRQVGAWCIASIVWLVGTVILLVLMAIGREGVPSEPAILLGSVLAAAFGGILLKMIARLLKQPGRCPQNFIWSSVASGTLLAMLALFVGQGDLPVEFFGLECAVYLGVVAASFSRSLLCYSARLWLHVAAALGSWPVVVWVIFLSPLSKSVGLTYEFKVVTFGTVGGALSAWFIFRGWNRKRNPIHWRLAGLFGALVGGGIFWWILSSGHAVSYYENAVSVNPDIRFWGTICIALIATSQWAAWVAGKLVRKKRGVGDES